MRTMGTKKRQNPRHKKTEAAASLSRTMPIALEEAPEVKAEMMLTIRGGNGTPPSNVPIERRTYTIGRHDGTDIHIASDSASRQHARIFFLHEEEIIEDLSSTNGTFVNGVRVARCVLQNNDIIRIGDATMLFSRATKEKT